MSKGTHRDKRIMKMKTDTLVESLKKEKEMRMSPRLGAAGTRQEKPSRSFQFTKQESIMSIEAKKYKGRF